MKARGVFLSNDLVDCHAVKVLFIEPPKQPWFIMGQYIPPPLGLLCLAAYLDTHYNDCKIQVMDCQAEEANWSDVSDRISTFHPDIVAPSTLSTGNAELVIRIASLAKNIDPSITTLAGGNHFTALAEESLKRYPQLDFVVRGEGEVTLLELVQGLEQDKDLTMIPGLSFRQKAQIVHTSNRPLIKDLNNLPMPGYKFVREHMEKYHFPAGKDLPYALIEGSRGCDYTCTFCGQWRYWGHRRRKTPQRAAQEFEHLYQEYGSRFLWFVDDYVSMDEWMDQFCDELLARNITEDLMWFAQIRADQIVQGKELLPKMRETGAQWMMVGLESGDPEVLNRYQKGMDESVGREAIELLKEHDILAQSTAIIGDRPESLETLEAFRKWINEVDPDIAIFMTMTPFPGTPLYTQALRNGWIEDHEWEHYDMIHAIMPTEHLTRKRIQQELFRCYRKFYGWRRRFKGVLWGNKIKKTYYRHMMWKGFLNTLKGLFRI